MKYTTVLFDLDGTLTESGEGIAKSVQYALEKQGIQEEDLEKLKAFVGPPLIESFMKYYGMTRETAEKTDLAQKLESAKARIAEVEAGEPEGAIYDLNGVRVEHPTKGVYVRNGKKFVVK